MKRARLGSLVRPVALAGAALTLGPLIAGAILVSPHALFITHQQRTGDIYLVNRGDTPEEVSVEFQFGYPATDSVGNIGIRLVSEPGPEVPSAAGWLRAFPRRARVDPGRRQRVRVRATPPPDLPDGEYWSRLIVTSRSAQPPIALGADTAVRAGVILQLRTITSVSYRKGAVSTGVTLDEFSASGGGDSLEAWVGLTRRGNAAFLGSVLFELRDAADNLVDSWKTPIAVYYSVRRRFALAVDSVASGSYRLRLYVSTDRDDLDSRYILPAAAIESARDVVVSRP